jgi:hypothetical protein
LCIAKEVYMALNNELSPYRLNNITSKDNFFIYYNGVDESGADLEISEFFPSYMCSRGDDGTVAIAERFANEFSLMLNRYKNGCLAIQSLSDAAFNPIIDVVERNNTCYMVRKKCEDPTLTTFMSGHRMDFYEGFLFIKPLLTFLSQAERSQVFFTFTLDNTHVNRYGRLILNKSFTVETKMADTVSDIVKVYYFLLVGRPYDPEKPSAREYGVMLPPRLETLINDVLNGEGSYGSIDDFSKNLKYLVDEAGGRKDDEADEGKKVSPVFKWVFAVLSVLLVGSITFLIIFVLIPGYRKARPDLADPSLISTPAPAPAATADVYDFTMLTVTNPADSSDILKGSYLQADGVAYYRTYNNGWSLAKRRQGGGEEILSEGARPAFIAEKDGYVYFSDGESGNSLKRISADGGVSQDITDNCAMFLCIIENYIYYTNHSDRDLIYRVDLTDLSEEPYIRAASYETVTDGRSLYFINGGRDFTVYKADIGDEGPVFTQLNTENSANLCYSNGMLFYTAADGHIRAMTTDGRQVTLDCRVRAVSLEAADEWLIMVEADTYRARSYNLDTKATGTLNAARKAAYAYPAGGGVYACGYDDVTQVDRYVLR